MRRWRTRVCPNPMAEALQLLINDLKTGDYEKGIATLRLAIQRDLLF